MVATFILALLAGVCCLYVPGYLFMRGLRMAPAVALVLGPVYSIAAYSVLAIVLARAGVGAGPFAIGLPVLAAAVAVFALRMPLRRGPVAARVPSARFEWASAGLYVLVGLGVSCYAFLGHLPDLSAFTTNYDNVHHFGQVRSFLVSGDWSSLGVTLYPAGGGAEYAPLVKGGFYPSAWHLLAALLLSMVRAPLTLATNAVNVLFVGVVYPLSTWLLVRVLFPARRLPVLLGSLLAVASVAFPWMLLVSWQLYPNLAAFALVPLALSSFVAFFSDLPAAGPGPGAARGAAHVPAGSVRAFWHAVPPLFGASRRGLAAVLVLCLLCFAFLQPNAVFTCMLALGPYCAWRVALAAGRRWAGRGDVRVRQLFCAAGFIVFFCAAWYACFRLPFMQDVVWFHWKATHSVAVAVGCVVGQLFYQPTVQALFALLVAVGVVASLRRRTYLWLTVSYLLACIVFVVDVSVEGGLAKHLLAGFWYSDYCRVAAQATILAVPLAVLGAVVLCDAVVACRVRRMARSATTGPDASAAVRVKRIVAAVAMALVLVAVYTPSLVVGGVQVETPFGRVQAQTARCNAVDGYGAYNADKRAFMEQVRQVVGEDQPIVNNPMDGSCYAYGVDGCNVYNRYIADYGDPSVETKESSLLRMRLDRVATERSVQAALRAVGARYYVVLDPDPAHPDMLFNTYDASLWTGMLAVDDDTPGFEVVLAQGDMRLYRIAALD